MYSLKPIFNRYPIHHPLLTNFEQKYTETLAIMYEILQTLSRVYTLVKYPTVVNRMPDNRTILKEIFHQIPSIFIHFPPE